MVEAPRVKVRWEGRGEHERGEQMVVAEIKEAEDQKGGRRMVSSSSFWVSFRWERYREPTL